MVCGLAALVAGQGYYTKGRTHSRGKGYFPALHGRLYGHSSYGHLYDRQRPAAAAAVTAAGAPPPTQYDTYCDPRAAPKCAENGTTYCLLDFEYPVLEIKVNTPLNIASSLVGQRSASTNLCPPVHCSARATKRNYGSTVVDQ